MARHAHDKGSGYQAFLLDYMMSDRDKTKTAKKLREFVPDTVPILFLTA